MMSHEFIGIVTLAVSLLGTVLALVWKISSLATKLTDSITHLERKDKELEEKIKTVDSISELKSTVEHIKENYALVPKLFSKVEVLEAQFKSYTKFSGELRKVTRQSRPDTEGDDE